MGDGTEEETVEKSTDELLSETKDLLADIDAGEEHAGAEGTDGSSTSGSESHPGGGGRPAPGSGEDAPTRTESALSGLRDRLGGGGAGGAGGADAESEEAVSTERAPASTSDDRRFRRYFEPRSAGISAVLVLAGALLGGIVPIPLIGSLTKLLGVLGATFLHGVTASQSRYAETFVAGGVVGAALAVLTNPILALSGVGVPIVAVSTTLVVLAALVGHYFGRDLRDGLTRDVGGGGGGGAGGGGDDDVPGW